MKNLVLIGFMGSGKSTVGRHAAAELGMQFVDMDRWIEEREGCSISEIFSRKGESVFRDLESHAVEQLSLREGLVIATGGGVVLKPANLERLGRCGIVVCLRVDSKTALARTRGHAHRPLLAGKTHEERVQSLLQDRQALYDAIPLFIDATQPLKQVIDQTVRLYRKETKSA